MKNYLKLFKDVNEYSQSSENPKISHIIDQARFIGNVIDRHEYVDLGLPSETLWATMNVGASSSAETGLYYQWGDSKGYLISPKNKKFSWRDYEYCNGESSPTDKDMTKYNSTDHLVTLEASDDAVAAAWGGSWRMPTEADFIELLDNCSIERIRVPANKLKIYGHLFTSIKNGKTIFLLDSGSVHNGNISIPGYGGSYWTSSVNKRNLIDGKCLTLGSGICEITSKERSYGFNIRGVIKPKKE